MGGSHQLLVQAKLIGFEVQSAESLAMAWHEARHPKFPHPNPDWVAWHSARREVSNPAHHPALRTPTQQPEWEVNDERPPTPPRRTELLQDKQQHYAEEARPSLGETMDWDLGGVGWSPTEQTTLMDPPPPRPVTPVRKSRSAANDLSAMGGGEES